MPNGCDDAGIRAARGEYFVTMHSDVFVKSDAWLEPFLREADADPAAAGIGAWKLDIENRLYAAQKQLIGYATGRLKTLLGRKKDVKWKQGHYPRDYCAMYRRDVILENGFTFRQF